jgi:hypothetical protein
LVVPTTHDFQKILHVTAINFFFFAKMLPTISKIWII